MNNLATLRTRPSPKLLLADYLANIYPARRHGATDCGECLTRQDDADHMIQWLAERGVAVVGTKGAAPRQSGFFGLSGTDLKQWIESATGARLAGTWDRNALIEKAQEIDAKAAGR